MSILSIDSFVVMGGGHDICQDYAKTTDNVIIVCDGCSSSSDSDFGAQVLARSISHKFKDIMVNQEDFRKGISDSIFTAHQLSSVLKLPNESLDATAVVGVVHGDKIHFFMAGDGAFAWKYKGIDANYVMVQYIAGAPEYLSYTLEDARHKKYHEWFGNKRTLQCEGNIDIIDLPDVNDKPIYCLSDDTKNLEWAAVFTDGVSSFQGKNSFDIMKELTNFKNFRGKFMKRRAKRFFTDNKVYHDDDVACAAVSFLSGV